MKLAFRVDASRALGLGHLTRCIALAEKFSEKTRCQVEFLTRRDELAEAFLRNRGWTVHWLGGPGQDEGEALCKPGFHAEILFTDLRVADAGAIDRWKAFTDLLVSVDDDSPIYFSSDVLINPNANPEFHHRYAPSTEYYRGLEYIILRREVEAAKPVEIRDTMKELLVCFGGSDPEDLTRKVCEMLQGLPGRDLPGQGPTEPEALPTPERVRVVVGGGYSHSTAWMQTLNGQRFRVERGVTEMLDLMRQADFAILSGGTLMYEACVLGLPAGIIAQNEEQAREARYFDHAQAVRFIGRSDENWRDQLPDLLARIRGSRKARSELAARGRSLLDGHGAARIVDLVLRRWEERSRKRGDR